MNRWGLRLLGLLGVILLADSVGWWWATGLLRSGLARSETAAIEQGWRVTRDPIVVRGGWPLAATLTLAGVAIDSPSALPIHATADRLVVRLDPFAMGHLLIASEGARTVSIGALPPLAIRAGTLEADLTATTATTAALHGAGLMLVAMPPATTSFSTTPVPATIPVPVPVPAPPPATAEGGAGVPAASMTLAELTVRFTPTETTLSAEDLTLASRLAAPDRSIRIATVVAHIAPGLAGLTEAAGPEASLIAWRKIGGRVVLERATLRWGPLDASGTATVGLDAALHPLGTAELTLSGYEPFLDRLTAVGILPARTARVFRAALALLMLGGADGSPGPVTVSLTAQDGVLSAAGVPLARLPQVMP